MTTTFDYNLLQQWSNSELIEQILLLQDYINNNIDKESQCYNYQTKTSTKQKYYFYKQNKNQIDNNIN